MYVPGELVAQAGQFCGADLAQQHGTVAELAQICQAWGAAIATLHTISTRRSSAALAPRPWALNPRHLMPSVRDVARGSGYAAVLEAYESSPDLRAAATEVDERWTEQHCIHGNLGASTVRVEHHPALRVSFLDWEQAGLGDPAWDLASAVDTIALLSGRWHAMSQQLIDYLILGYRRAGGPGRLYPAIQAVRALVTAAWVADLSPQSARQPVGAELALWLESGARVRSACRMADGRPDVVPFRKPPVRGGAPGHAGRGRGWDRCSGEWGRRLWAATVRVLAGVRAGSWCAWCQAMAQPPGPCWSPRMARRARLIAPARVRMSVRMRAWPRHRALRPPHGRLVK